jgi:hypothetical protein
MGSRSRTPRNNRGQWASDSVDRVSTDDIKEYRDPKPQKGQSAKFWQIFNVGTTERRSELGVTLLTWATYLLYILGIILFWVVLFIFFKTLLFWANTGRAVGTVLCWLFRDCTLRSVGQAIFSTEEKWLGYTLGVTLDGPEEYIKLIDQPLRFSNPVPWSFAALGVYVFNRAMYYMYIALMNFKGMRSVHLPR